MISHAGITLNPPLLYMDEDCVPYPEVYSLINSLTNYFSQTGTIYDAELTVSNNEWISIPSLPGCRKRKDYTFSLTKLKEVHVKKDKIVFKLNKGNECIVNLSEDFFYFIECEEAFYD